MATVVAVAESTGAPADLPLTIQRAAGSDLDVVLEILREAAHGRRPGMDPVWGQRFPDVARDVQAGLVYLARLGDQPVGVFVLRWSDDRVWGPDDGEAGYVHRLAARQAFAGKGLGRRLLASAAAAAAARRRTWLRLDCDRHNRPLRAYYERLGFTHVRDVDALPRTTRPGTRDASLYQCRAADLLLPGRG